MIHQDRQILEPKTTRPESVHGSGKGGNASGDNDSTTVPLNDPCDECRLILRFKHPGTMYEKFVSTVISSPVHVDIVLDKIGTPHKRVCFSAYMNEKFSMTLMPQEMIQDKLYENFSLRISNRDFVKCSKYLQKMMDKVPYNYSDAMVLMPSIPSMGETIANTMVQDIERGTDPEKISSVFCSQAAVLVCKECLQDGEDVHRLSEAISKLNSRLTSPLMLQSIFQIHSRKIPSSELEMNDP